MSFNPAWLASGLGGGWLWGKSGGDIFKGQEIPLQYYPGKVPEFSPTSYEQTGLSLLGNLLKQPSTGALTQAGEQQLLNVLSPDYTNPFTSYFSTAMRDLSNQNLQSSIDDARRSAGARGTYFTTSAMQQENDLRQRANTDLNAIIAQAMENRYGQQLNAVPMTQQLEQYRMFGAPLTQIGASQQYGGLERAIQEGNFERAYKVWQGARATPQSPSVFSQLAPILGTVLGSVLNPTNVLYGGLRSASSPGNMQTWQWR